MTNSEQALREFVDKWGWFVKATSIDMTQFELNKDTEQCLSDLTALISEHYVAKEEIDKMVSERLREELGLYNDWLNGAAGKYLTSPYIDEYLTSEYYLKTREK